MLMVQLRKYSVENWPCLRFFKLLEKSWIFFSNKEIFCILYIYTSILIFMHFLLTLPPFICAFTKLLGWCVTVKVSYKVSKKKLKQTKKESWNKMNYYEGCLRPRGMTSYRDSKREKKIPNKKNEKIHARKKVRRKKNFFFFKNRFKKK